jgi:hypothetical protein
MTRWLVMSLQAHLLHNQRNHRVVSRVATKETQRQGKHTDGLGHLFATEYKLHRVSIARRENAQSIVV